MKTAFNNPELVAIMRKQAIELRDLYNTPLKIAFNGKQIKATYKGCGYMFIAYKTYQRNKAEIRSWQRSVDIRVNETIKGFLNPIYREVFGLS